MLEKLFIKDYKNTNNSKVRYKYGVVSSLYGITTNLILFVVKMIIGIISGSIAILSDAFNNLSDGISAIVTLVGFKLSSKPADSEHPFGHARYEYISALIVSFIICIFGAILAKNSLDKIITPQIATINWIVFLILGLSIIIKFSQYLIYKNFGNKIDSDSIKANAIDARNDTIVATLTFIALLIMEIFNINIDAYVGLAVSIFIVISGFKLMLDTMDPLIGEKPDKELVEKIKNKLKSYDGVLGFHELMVHSYGKNKNIVSVHIEVSADVNPLETHDLLDDIEEDFLNEFGIHIVIHSDAIPNNDKKVNYLKKKVQNCLSTLNTELIIHDFRVSEGQKHTKIMFDCKVPYYTKITKTQILNHLKTNFNKETIYSFSIDIDRDFV